MFHSNPTSFERRGKSIVIILKNFHNMESREYNKNLETDNCKIIVGNYEKRYLSDLFKWVIKICTSLSNCET